MILFVFLNIGSGSFGENDLERQRRSSKTNSETVLLAQVRDDGGLDKVNSRRNGEKLSLFCRDYLVVSGGKETVRSLLQGS